MPGGHHPRAVDPAGVDRPAEGDVEQVPACLDKQSEVAHGGEARAQGAAGVADRTQDARGGIVLNLGQPGILAAPAHQEVDLHVHQAGKQDGIAEIDHITFDGASDADDAIAFDTDDPRPDDLAGIDVK